MFPKVPKTETDIEQPNRCNEENKQVEIPSLQNDSITQSFGNKWKQKKNVQKFHCEKCDYNTMRKANYDRHLTTLRHKLSKNEQSTQFTCESCNKSYTSRSGLWRHKSRCKKEKKTEKKQENDKYYGLLKTLIDENKKMSVQNQKLTETIQDMVPQIGNNTINNNQKISINVFLNENCKNAMNLKDFIETLQITLPDLSYAREYGGVEAISDIFIKRLTDMKPTERPIHCSDKKRLQFYVKDEDKWEKDNEHKKIDNSIREINNKQLNKLHEWTKTHPDWNKNEKESEEYMKMVSKIAWSSDDRKKNKDKVKRNISQVIEIKDAMK